MFAPASVSFVSSVIVRMSFMVARVLFALSLVMFNISRYGIFVSVTDTVLVAVSGTLPDEDPAYNYTITSNTSAVNSRIPGTYLIEYMAQPDPLETYLKLQQEQYL